MTGRRIGLAGLAPLLLVLGAGCSRDPGRVETPPSPSPRPAAAPEPVPTPTEAAAVITAVHEVPFRREAPTPRPTVDVSNIPNFDRPSDPASEGRAARLARCLTLSAETIPQPGLSGGSTTRARVRARNSCTDWIAAEDTSFEIVSFGAARSERLGRAAGSFGSAIPPLSSSAETVVGIPCPENLPGGCRYSVTGWWVAEAGTESP